MSNRTYRLILGALLLLALYFDLHYVIYGVIALLLLEGVSNQRITLLAQKISGASNTIDEANDNLTPLHANHRFNFEAERAWRLVVASLLLITYVLLYDRLWFFPWFMGFAIFGAGASGVCPMLIGIKWAGCK